MGFFTVARQDKMLLGMCIYQVKDVHGSYKAVSVFKIHIAETSQLSFGLPGQAKVGNLGIKFIVVILDSIEQG